MTAVSGNGYAMNNGRRLTHAGGLHGAGGEPIWVRARGEGHGQGRRTGYAGETSSGAGTAKGTKPNPTPWIDHEL